MFILPTSVGLRYGRTKGSVRSFSWKYGIGRLLCQGHVPIPSRHMTPRLWLSPPTVSAYGVGPASVRRTAYPSSSLLTSLPSDRCWNIDQLAIDYAVSPRLRSRLTLGGRAWPRNPWVFGVRDSHSHDRYLCLHLHLYALQSSLPVGLQRTYKAPLPLPKESAASVSGLAPLYLRRRFT